MKAKSVALCLLLAMPVAVMTVPAAAESLGEKTGVNSTLGIAPKTEDFVSEVAISDMFEIQSSKLAEEKGNDGAKAFAKKMVADHTKTSSELKPLAEAAKIKVPAALDSAHQSKLDTLKGLKGEDFNKQYKKDQVAAHDDAVNLFERYGKGGDNDKIKAFASQTLPTLKEHQAMAQSMK